RNFYLDISFIEYEKKLKAEILKKKDRLLSKPGFCESDFRKDFRFRLGLIAGMEEIIKLNEEWRSENA
ncbi:MAG: hypothetical protein ACTSYA_05685, partial [Candidatus Kariarchaeaceae archaeon]